MRRGLHIAISLVTVALLLGPFDCFAARMPSRQAADCCLKGKCDPTAKSDDCCKNTVPGRDQLVAPKADDHSAPLIAVITAYSPTLVSPSTIDALGEKLMHPPPRIAFSSASLPLLI